MLAYLFSGERFQADPLNQLLQHFCFVSNKLEYGNNSSKVQSERSRIRDATLSKVSQVAPFKVAVRTVFRTPSRQIKEPEIVCAAPTNARNSTGETQSRSSSCQKL